MCQESYSQTLKSSKIVQIGSKDQQMTDGYGYMYLVASFGFTIGPCFALVCKFSQSTVYHTKHRIPSSWRSDSVSQSLRIISMHLTPSFYALEYPNYNHLSYLVRIRLKKGFLCIGSLKRKRSSLGKSQISKKNTFSSCDVCLYCNCLLLPGVPTYKKKKTSVPYEVCTQYYGCLWTNSASIFTWQVAAPLFYLNISNAIKRKRRGGAGGGGGYIFHYSQNGGTYPCYVQLFLLKRRRTKSQIEINRIQILCSLKVLISGIEFNLYFFAFYALLFRSLSNAGIKQRACSHMVALFQRVHQRLKIYAYSLLHNVYFRRCRI